MKKILFAPFLLLLLQSCDSSAFLNKAYEFNPKAELRLAIAPIGSEPNFSDTAFARIFFDSAHAYTLMTPEETRLVVLKDSEMLRIFNALISGNHTKSQLKQNPGLGDILSGADIQSLRTNLFPANCLLVPVVFNVSSALNNTFGKTRFRLYDLDSGQLVYDNEQTLNVNIGGDYGKRRLTAVLVAMAHGDFRDQYLKKTKRPN